MPARQPRLRGLSPDVSAYGQWTVSASRPNASGSFVVVA